MFLTISNFLIEHGKETNVVSSKCILCFIKLGILIF